MKLFVFYILIYIGNIERYGLYENDYSSSPPHTHKKRTKIITYFFSFSYTSSWSYLGSRRTGFFCTARIRECWCLRTDVQNHHSGITETDWDSEMGSLWRVLRKLVLFVLDFVLFSLKSLQFVPHQKTTVLKSENLLQCVVNIKQTLY